MELDNKVIELQEEIQSLTKAHFEKENELSNKITALQKRLYFEKRSKEQIIAQAEQELNQAAASPPDFQTQILVK